REYDHDFPDRGIHQARLMLYNLGTKQVVDVSSPSFDQAVNLTPNTWLSNGKLMFSSASGVYTDFYTYDVAAKRYTRITNKLGASGASFSKDRSRVVYSRNTNTEPSNIYAAKGDFTGAQRLTDVNPQVAEWALGESRVIQWKSSDGWPVEG